MELLSIGCAFAFGLTETTVRMHSDWLKTSRDNFVDSDAKAKAKPFVTF